MKQYAPLIVVFLAIFMALLTIVRDGSFQRLSELRSSIFLQKEKNAVLGDHVSNLKQEVAGLQHNTRIVEKAARNELGMARPDEMIFLFDESKLPQRK